MPIGEYLKMPMAYAIIQTGRNEKICPIGQSKNPGVAAPGFSFRLLLSTVAVQPFANVIGRYTCCDGNKK